MEGHESHFSGENLPPVISLNLSGTSMKVSRKLLQEKLGQSPMWIALLGEEGHWKTIKVGDEIYLERDPSAFADLIQYLRYGKDFLNKIHSDEFRLQLLRAEADFWLVESLEKDIEELGIDEYPVTFHSNQWVSFAAIGTVSDWEWQLDKGNPEIATIAQDEDHLGGIEIKQKGTYLMFFRMSTIATSPTPQPGYDDRVKVLRSAIFWGSGNGGHPIIARCGIFDPRDSDESGENEKFKPMRHTASVAEVVALEEGHVIGFQHGYCHRNFRGYLVSDMCLHPSDPATMNRFTLIKVCGNSIARYDRVRPTENEYESVPIWRKAITDFPPTSFEPSLRDAGRIIEATSKGGGLHHLVLEKLASMFRGESHDSRETYSVRMKVTTKDGVRLHDVPVIEYPFDFHGWKHATKALDYGSVNDVVFLPEKGHITFETSTENVYLAEHGTYPALRRETVTQNLFLLALAPTMKMDRYSISRINGKFKRVLPNRHNRNAAAGTATPLFFLEEDHGGYTPDALVASNEVFGSSPTTCILLATVPIASFDDPICYLRINYTTVATSLLGEKDVGGPLRPFHFFHEVVELCAGDRIQVGLKISTHSDTDGYLVCLVMEK